MAWVLIHRTYMAGILALSFQAAHAATPIIVGTGPISGFAFPLGGELCRLYEQAKDDKAHCTVSSTDGSVEDLNRLRDGDIDFALVQSDRVADALTASGPFAGKPPFAELRSLVGFYAETLAVIVRNDGPVKTVDDLKGKRMIVGEPGMIEPLFSDFLEGLGWSKADLGGTVEMARAQQVTSLCGGKVAAIAVAAPHPNGFVREALSACPAHLLDLAGPGLDAAVSAHRAYAPFPIAAGTYAGMDQPIQSFGPRAVLVTTAKASDAAVLRMLAATFSHLDTLKNAHPAFAGLDRDDLTDPAGLAAERHPAATKYLSDNKLIDTGGGG